MTYYYSSSDARAYLTELGEGGAYDKMMAIPKTTYEQSDMNSVKRKFMEIKSLMDDLNRRVIQRHKITEASKYYTSTHRRKLQGLISTFMLKIKYSKKGYPRWQVKTFAPIISGFKEVLADNQFPRVTFTLPECISITLVQECVDMEHNFQAASTRKKERRLQFVNNLNSIVYQLGEELKNGRKTDFLVTLCIPITVASQVTSPLRKLNVNLVRMLSTYIFK
jgi:hypothetical protein